MRGLTWNGSYGLGARHIWAKMSTLYEYSFVTAGGPLVARQPILERGRSGVWGSHQAAHKVATLQLALLVRRRLSFGQ